MFSFGIGAWMRERQLRYGMQSYESGFGYAMMLHYHRQQPVDFILANVAPRGSSSVDEAFVKGAIAAIAVIQRLQSI